MNKLLKYILIGIGITSLCIASVKADYMDGLTYLTQINLNNSSIDSSNVNNYFGITDNESYLCFNIIEHNSNGQIRVRIGSTQSYLTVNGGVGFACLGAWNGAPFVLDENGGNTTAKINVYIIPRVGIQVFSITSGNPVLTSLQCQTEYSLIPISEVTPNYCALNFGMIDPQECPINSGTGAIVRSNLMINDIPYAQNQNINVFIPDFLAWNISFNDLYTVIEVEGYDADTEYIENVINNEKMTPTNEDFTNMLTGLANLFPYLAIAFLMYWLIRLVYKSFK